MFGDLGKMIKAASEARKRMPEVQAKLEASEFVAEAGEGAVRATVNGKGRITGLTIAPSVLGSSVAAEALCEWIRGAIGEAQSHAADAAVAAMRELTGGMALPGTEGLI